MKKNTSSKIIVLIIMLSVLALSIIGGVLAKYITTLRSETVFTMDVGKRYPTITGNFIDSEEDFTISGSPTAGFKITLKNAPTDFTHVAYNVGTEIKYAEVSDKAFTIKTGTQEKVTLEKAKMYAFATVNSGNAMRIYNRPNRIAATFVPDNLESGLTVYALPAGKPNSSADPEGGNTAWKTAATYDNPGSFFGNSVKTVDFEDSISPTSTARWFNCFRQCTGISLAKLNTAAVTDMSLMFRYCNALQSLDLSGFNTTNVTSMNRMFSENKALTSLNISGFNTVNVKDMYAMFWYCEKLTSLDLSHFNTVKVSAMHEMFEGCKDLTSLNISGFNTAAVTNMTEMFKDCSVLRAIKIGSNWKTAATATNIFLNSTALVYRDGQLGSNTVTYTGWDATNKKANFQVDGYTLKNNPNTTENRNSCPYIGTATHLAGEVLRSNLTNRVEYGEKLENSISISSADSGGSWDSHVLTLAPAKMYSYATLPKTATADAPGPLNLYYRLNRIDSTFKPDNNPDADNLKIYNFWDYWYSMISDYANPEGSTDWQYLRSTSPETSAANARISPVASVKVNDSIPLARCRNLFHRFENCTSIDLTGLDTSQAPSVQSMFDGCVKLTSLDVSVIDTSNATSLAGMFANCKLLTELDVRHFVTTKVTAMSSMFAGCEKLTELDVTNFVTSKVTTMASMFYQCNDLTSLDVSNFDTAKVTAMSNMFQGCIKFTELDVTNFVTTNVTTMRSMFNSCQNLRNIDVTGFNTAKVTDMAYMFRGCRYLTSLDLSSFNTANVANMYFMFNGCSKLTTITVGAGWNTDNVADSTEAGKGSTNMFYGCTVLKGQNGTTYNANIIDKTYARVDTADTPGYLTSK